MKNLTKGALRKMVQEEMERQKRIKENTVAATPGMTYNTSRAFRKKNTYESK